MNNHPASEQATTSLPQRPKSVIFVQMLSLAYGIYFSVQLISKIFQLVLVGSVEDTIATLAYLMFISIFNLATFIGLTYRKLYGLFLGFLLISGMLLRPLIGQPDRFVHSDNVVQAAGRLAELAIMPLLFFWLLYCFGFSRKSWDFFGLKKDVPPNSDFDTDASRRSN